MNEFLLAVVLPAFLISVVSMAACYWYERDWIRYHKLKQQMKNDVDLTP